MLTTWIEAPALGRLGGPVRAGMWASVVVGIHPIDPETEVWLELLGDEGPIGPLPGYVLENRGADMRWHVPIPPQPVDSRLKYRVGARNRAGETAYSPYQELIVRPNDPNRRDGAALLSAGPAGLVGNRRMTIRVDERGGTYDIYYPTVGLHSDVRPAAGDLPESRAHFRSIVGGLALDGRIEWFCESTTWDASQAYLPGTNILVTDLAWRGGPVRVSIRDFAAMGDPLPLTDTGNTAPGQYLKRFLIHNDGPVDLEAVFGLFVHAEVNGGIGEPGLSWVDGERILLASNRGHGHANRKFARDSTVEFAIALDNRGPILCEPTGREEAILHRALTLPAGGTVEIDLIVAGAFTGWRGDTGTFGHWLRPALDWFRSTESAEIEQRTADAWTAFTADAPRVGGDHADLDAVLRRAMLAAAMHIDADKGSVAAGYDRGLHAYAWPRDAVMTAEAFGRLGRRDIVHGIYDWLDKVRLKNRPYTYWCQKYSLDGLPEWEAPSVDQTAVIPWGIEREYRRTGDVSDITDAWPVVRQAAEVCTGRSGHPGLRFNESIRLIESFGLWDSRFGAFLYSNAAAVAGLQAAARLAVILGHDENAAEWSAFADRLWNEGILGQGPRTKGPDRGLIQTQGGRFLDGRCVGLVAGQWTDRPERVLPKCAASDISHFGLAVPFGLLPADDARLLALADAVRRNHVAGPECGLITRWAPDDSDRDVRGSTPALRSERSSLATLWYARYLIRLARETGDAATQRLARDVLQGLLRHLDGLGMGLPVAWSGNGGGGQAAKSRSAGVWGLHVQLIEVILDLHGLDYDAVDGRLDFRPPAADGAECVAFAQTFACGHVEYQLSRRTDAACRRLTVQTQLTKPTSLVVHLPGQIPGLTVADGSPRPGVASKGRRTELSVALPAGSTNIDWCLR